MTTHATTDDNERPNWGTPDDDRTRAGRSGRRGNRRESVDPEQGTRDPEQGHRHHHHDHYRGGRPAGFQLEPEFGEWDAGPQDGPGRPEGGPRAGGPQGWGPPAWGPPAWRGFGGRGPGRRRFGGHGFGDYGFGAGPGEGRRGRGEFGPDGPEDFGPGGRGGFGPGGFGPGGFGPGGFGRGGFGPGGFGPGGRGFGPGGRGGRRRGRGNVRAAVLALLNEEPRHGYSIMTELAKRSGGTWQPSPGSVYPVLQQLQDEGLVSVQESDGRRVFSLTDAGRQVITENPSEYTAPWSAGDRDPQHRLRGLFQTAPGLLAAVREVARTGTDAQLEQARVVLDDARKAMYRILAEDAPGAAGSDPEGDRPESAPAE